MRRCVDNLNDICYDKRKGEFMPRYDKNRKLLRNAELVKLRDSSSPQLSFEEIGQVYGITRQAANKIYLRDTKRRWTR